MHWNSNDFLLTIFLKQNLNEATRRTQLVMTKVLLLRLRRHLVFTAPSFQRTGLPSFEGSYTTTLVNDLNKFKTSLVLLWFKNILKMPRKKPYSNKQKKKQLQEKREKKRVKNLGRLTSKWLELTVSNMHKYKLLYNIC